MKRALLSPGRHRAAAVLLVTVAWLAACTSSAGITQQNVTERVAQARTAQDHRALATYYEERASAALRDAEHCRQLRRRYERTPQGVYYPVGTALAMLKHYDELITNHLRNAVLYGHLAQWHGQQAAAAPPEGAEGR